MTTQPPPAKREPAKDANELLERLRRDFNFLEGLSYALPESDGGKQMRRRLQNMYDNVRVFLKTQDGSTQEGIE